jgi:hypothetical protein
MRNHDADPTAHKTTTPRRARTASRPFVGLAVLGIATAAALTACSDGSSTSAGSTAAATTGAASTQSSQQSNGTPSGSAASTPGAMQPSSTSDARSTPADTSGAKDPSGGSTKASLRVGRCTASNLDGSLTEGGGGAAGSTEPYIVLKNTGSKPCQLQGWPGVSLVGHGNGTQIGAAATQDRSSMHATVTLLPNGHAHAPLRIADALNYPKATCSPTHADGLRVYVPGETHSIYIKATGLTGCANKSVKLLEVQAVQPGVG